MRHREDQRVRRRQAVPVGKPYAVLVQRVVGRHQRVVDVGLDAELVQLADDVDHLRVANVGHVLLERQAEHVDARALDVATGVDHLLHGLARDVRPHAVVDPPPGQDHLRVVAGKLGLVREVVRVDADAVAADQARAERQEVPLGARGLQHLVRVDAQALEDDGQLVDEGDVEVALRVLDHLGRLGHLDRGRAIHPGLHHRAVERGDLLQGLLIIPRNHFENFREHMFLVARVDALGRVADVEVLAPAHPRVLLEDRHADLLGAAGIHGRFVDHRRAALHVAAHGLARGLKRAQVGLARGVDRRGHRDDDEVRLAERGGIVGRMPQLRFRELGARHFAGHVDAVLQVLDALLRQVVADGAALLAERDGHRQADVAQAEHRHRGELRLRPQDDVVLKQHGRPSFPRAARGSTRTSPWSFPARPSGAWSAGSRAGAAPCRCRHARAGCRRGAPRGRPGARP